MFNNMLFGLKRRIIDEIEGAFLNHPAFADKVKVTNKFPYTERVQYGVIIRNSSASQMRMSADNYLADQWSHVRLARTGNYPGLALEWVKENSLQITERVIEEDVSVQLDITQRRFFTANQILMGVGDTHYATRPDQVIVTINGLPVIPEYVNGRERTVLLSRAPDSNGDVVKISYLKRKIVTPGIFLIDFTTDKQFYVTPTGIVSGEVVIDITTGTETTATLLNTPVHQNTERISLRTLSGDAPYSLIRDTDYSIDYPTAVITFLQPLSKNMRLLASYRYDPGISTGPYTVANYQEIHDAIPGVVLCVGRRAKALDRNLVIVSQFREEQARIYGGHWDMSISVGVISKDCRQMEEMTDQIINYLWGIRKNVLEYEGITLNRVEPSGETEESFIETTGDLYYESSVEISVQTEWQEFVPYEYTINDIFVESSVQESLALKDYIVLKDGKMVSVIVPDTRPVIKYGTTGYERVV